MRTCSVCGAQARERGSYCDYCYHIKQKGYRESHKEKAKAYREKNRERLLARSREYWAARNRSEGSLWPREEGEHLHTYNGKSFCDMLEDRTRELVTDSERKMFGGESTWDSICFYAFR